MPQSATTDSEDALHAFLAPLQEEAALRLRTLAHAWTGGGGHMQIGRFTVRLTAGAADDAPPFTAATLHAPHGKEDAPRLEFCRAILANHGVSEDDWIHWCDDLADLPGFDPGAKFPTITLDDSVDATVLVRLTVALRDLARMVP